MTGLGELDAKANAFKTRNIRVHAISIDSTDDAEWASQQFPSLNVISDPKSHVINSFDVTHPNSSPTGGNTAAPTTILIDQQGVVRWIHRPADLFSRYPIHALLEAIDEALP